MRHDAQFAGGFGTGWLHHFTVLGAGTCKHRAAKQRTNAIQLRVGTASMRESIDAGSLEQGPLCSGRQFTCTTPRGTHKLNEGKRAAAAPGGWLRTTRNLLEGTFRSVLASVCATAGTTLLNVRVPCHVLHGCCTMTRVFAAGLGYSNASTQ